MKTLDLLKRPWLGGLFLAVLIATILLVMSLLRPTIPGNDFRVTQAHQTVAARLTQAHSTASFALTATSAVMAMLPTANQPATASSSATSTPAGPPTNTPPDRPPLSPSPTAACDRAIAGSPIDITVPDEMEFRPGEAFTKIWRLQNAGTCTWTREYAARFFYGDRMNAPDVNYLDKEVLPGDVVEIAVDMVSPGDPGKYQGNWKLSNAGGFLFGIGPRGDAPFWVRIVVLHLATPTLTPNVTSTVAPTPTATLTPTSTYTPTPPIHSSGSLFLQIAQTLDLDAGELNPSNGYDLAYLLEAGFHLLSPQLEAVLGIFGAQEPGLADCIGAAMSSAPVALESLSPGAYLCYQTDLGRQGWLRYDSLDGSDGSASLVYHTWVNP